MTDWKNILAKKIAKDIFECGNEPSFPTSRIQFMAERDDGSERGQGGLCEVALVGLIEKSLMDNTKESQ